MSPRLSTGYKTFSKGGSHLVYCHAGVVQNALLQLDIKDFMVRNCGVVSFKFDLEQGVPTHLLGYWDPALH